MRLSEMVVMMKNKHLSAVLLSFLLVLFTAFGCGKALNSASSAEPGFSGSAAFPGSVQEVGPEEAAEAIPEESGSGQTTAPGENTAAGENTAPEESMAAEEIAASGETTASGEYTASEESRTQGETTASAGATASEEGSAPPAPALREDGSYTTKEDVSLFLYTYGRLPDNFITKSEARALGWEGGGLDDYLYGACIGGDRFGNYEGTLPKRDGLTYRECDIDTMHQKKRGAKRLVYSSAGEIYDTEDHYDTFEQLYP